MSFIIVNVEFDGPIPAEFSLVFFGAVLFDDHLDKSFYGKICFIGLAVSDKLRMEREKVANKLANSKRSIVIP